MYWIRSEVTPDHVGFDEKLCQCAATPLKRRSPPPPPHAGCDWKPPPTTCTCTCTSSVAWRLASLPSSTIIGRSPATRYQATRMRLSGFIALSIGIRSTAGKSTVRAADGTCRVALFHPGPLAMQSEQGWGRVGARCGCLSEQH